MKSILVLSPVSSFEQVTDLGALGRTVWYVHTLENVCGVQFRHWSRDKILGAGVEERVVCRVGKNGRMGKPVGRMVQIC